MAITPDTKDWTWVLERPCPECGFDTQGFAVEAVPGMIAAGEPVSRVAGRVGYDTPSAFVAAFRRETGQTPGALFKDRAFKDGAVTP